MGGKAGTSLQRLDATYPKLTHPPGLRSDDEWFLGLGTLLAISMVAVGGCEGTISDLYGPRPGDFGEVVDVEADGGTAAAGESGVVTESTLGMDSGAPPVTVPAGSASGSYSDGAAGFNADAHPGTKTDAGTGTGTTPGAGTTNPSLGPVHCTPPLWLRVAGGDYDLSSLRTNSEGLPLVESNPGAPIVLHLDFDGGTYDPSSSAGGDYEGYNGSGAFDDFDHDEQRDILLGWSRTVMFFAMFDVNVTTDSSKRSTGRVWATILISEEYSGGQASTSSGAIGQHEYARAIVSPSTIRSSDRGRRLVHELGHNFTLDHNGYRDEKWEDWSGWNGNFGTVMGGGGEGKLNGWGRGLTTGGEFQDSMEVIRSRVAREGSAHRGWSQDDFPDVAPLCVGEGGRLYRSAVLNSLDDTDTFALAWHGGDLRIDSRGPDVSIARVEIKVYDGAGRWVGGDRTVDLDAGDYTIEVSPGPRYPICDDGSSRCNVDEVSSAVPIGAYEIEVL